MRSGSEQIATEGRVDVSTFNEHEVFILIWVRSNYVIFILIKIW